MYVCRNNILQPTGRLLVSQTSLAFLKKWYRQYFFSWHFEVAKTSKLNLVGASLNSMWNCHVCDLLRCMLFQNRLPYAPHYNPLLIWNRSWILTIHKVRILQKKLLKKTFLAFKNGVKRIQTMGYNGPRTVCMMINSWD